MMPEDTPSLLGLWFGFEMKGERDTRGAPVLWVICAAAESIETLFDVCVGDLYLPSRL